MTAADTIGITFGNLNGSPIDAASETYKVSVMRPVKTPTGAFSP